MPGELKDPAIKLFGKTIPLPFVPTTEYEVVQNEELEPDGFDKDECDYETRETSSEARASGGANREDESLLVNSKDATSSDTTAGAGSKTDEEQSTNNPRDVALKKPEKLLPCPRCNSVETKFCYYNNYNVNQSRHFCKNCQRYWTAGGTMRNVPMGAGRRKSKSASPASNCSHITIPEGVHIPNGFHHSPPLKTNGMILTFGSADNRLWESMESVLKIGEKSLMNGTQNGFHKLEEAIASVACRNRENGADSANNGKVGVTRSNHKRENDVSALQNPVAVLHQMPCFPGTPWPYPASPPALVPQVIPMPFYTSPAYWSFPWIPLQPLPPTVSTSGPNTPSLGKHSRDENMGKTESSDKEETCLWMPKTLRIDDSREDAKSSSIWATLGMENSKGDPGIEPFKAFQPNNETSAFLEANPAALSRSVNFHEKA